MSRLPITLAVAATLLSCGPSLAQSTVKSAPLPAPSRSSRVTKQPVAPPSALRFAEAAPAKAPSVTLPNGASSISESYGDWSVHCGIESNRKVCVISQIQGDKQTGQRTFAIELGTPANGKTDGTILMPFGLKLDAGATLKIDGNDLGQGVRFSTCVPDGCLLSVSFPTVAMDAMKNGKALVVTGTSLADAQAIAFSVSLDGFTAAVNRLTELGQ